MAVKAKLKFRGDLPWELEHKLCTKLGFRIYSRCQKDWLIVEKVDHGWKPEVLVNGELPEDIRNTLIKRCNTIVNHFLDPDAHAYTIRTRLNNIAATLPPLQRKFVHDWITRNIEGDD